MRFVNVLQVTVQGLFVPVLLFSLAACGQESSGAAPAGGGGGGGRPGGGPGGGAAQVTPVEIALVERVTMANTSLVTGLLEPIRTVSVNAQLGGALLDVNVEEGSRVRAGQLLAEIDSRELAAQVRAAEAALTFAQSTATRSADLFRQQIVTAAENERDQSALASAQATLTQLNTRLGFAQIKSPISGVVTARFVQGGDIVSPNTRLFTVSDLSTLVVRLPVSELEVSQLRTGAAVNLRVDALGGAQFPGRIRRIFPAADSVSRLVPVEVAVTGASTAQLRPGYTVRALLRLDAREDALVVPTRAVLGATGARSVFVIRDGLAERRPVRVGSDVDGQLEVFSGLAVGDTVIVAGNSLVRDGGKVRIVDPLSPDAPSRAEGTPIATPTALADSTARRNTP
jgi:membrane fusion protein (multidrug efflux system)